MTIRSARRFADLAARQAEADLLELRSHERHTASCRPPRPAAGA